MPKFLDNIDLNKNQLLKAVVENLATAPGSPSIGQIYFDTVLDAFGFYTSGGWAYAGASSGTLADGTYGDIIVSGSGTVFTIAADSVTYAKMQNVAANNVLLGNIAGAGGIVSELTAAQVRTLINVEDGADVTDAANVGAAGGVLYSDSDVSAALWFIDEDSMASDSPVKAPSQQSVKAYVLNQISSALASAMTYKGGYNAATNSPDLDSTPISTKIGDTYTVTAAGTFFSAELAVGDVIICEAVDATTEAEWTIVEHNIPDIVNASETTAGLVEEATDAEVTAGTATGGTGAKLFVSPAKLKTSLGVTATLTPALVFTQAIGNGASTSIAVTHNIGRQYVEVSLYDTSTKERVFCDVVCTSTTVTTLNFSVAPGSNEYTVVITG